MWNKKYWKGRVKFLIKPYYHRLKRLLKSYRRIGLKCKDFSIISNNCCGGYVYQHLGIPYKTPTEGLYFTTKDYLKLVERPEYYFNHKVELIDVATSTLAKEGRNIHYPVGIIDDVEIYFMHYPDPKEALSKWNRRASRMNFKKLFFLLTETESCKEEHIAYFSKLIESKKINGGDGICLMLKDRDIPNTLYVPNVPKGNSNGNAAWKPQIIISSLNWKRILNNL